MVDLTVATRAGFAGSQSTEIQMAYTTLALLAAILQLVGAAQPTSKTQQFCVTEYGSKQVAVSTTTIARTFTFHSTIVVVVQPSRTITPPASTGKQALAIRIDLHTAS